MQQMDGTLGLNNTNQSQSGLTQKSQQQQYRDSQQIDSTTKDVNKKRLVKLEEKEALAR